MSRITGAIACLLALAMLLALASIEVEAGADKAPPWKILLPAAAYQELARRSVDRIHEYARDDGASDALRAEALILAGYTLSVKDATSPAAVRQKAIAIARLASQKDGAAEARKLAGELSLSKSGAAKETGAPVDWPALIGNIADIMTPLANKAKGGEGLPAELQYNVKLKKLNGTEALIVALSDKALSTTNAGKMAKELELTAYRVAAIGALTRRRGPHKNKDDAKMWDDQSIIMRDAGVELADGARRKDTAAIVAASKRLIGTCVECHQNFK
jgi:hypothetical protein